MGSTPNRLDLALAALAEGRFAEAFTDATLACDIAPEDPIPRIAVVHALLGLGLDEPALAQADALADEAPGLPSVEHTRAFVRARIGRREEAVALLRGALVAHPRDPDLLALLGDLFLDEEPATAEAHYRASLGPRPHDARVRNNLGVALRKQRRTREAAEAFREAVATDPDSADARRNLHVAVRDLLHKDLSGWVAAAFFAALMVWDRFAREAPVLNGLGLVAGFVASAVVVLAWNHPAADRLQRKLFRVDEPLYESYRRVDLELRADRGATRVR